SDMIPDCHPLPVEFAAITYAVQELSIIISVEVHTIYKTGVEVEAMHGAAVTAVVIYDMLKPIDPNVEIQAIRLQEKSGGKADRKNLAPKSLRCAAVVCSDSVFRGERQDTAGKAIITAIEKYGLTCTKYEVIPDDYERIQVIAKLLSE